MTTYALSVALTTGFLDAVEKTRAALAGQGFGVLTEIDVAATMKTKLGIDLEPHLILGACNPPLAYQALPADPSIGLPLPCNVVVRTLDPSRVLIEAMDPNIMVSATGNQALAPVAAHARALLTAALATLAADVGRVADE